MNRAPGTLFTKQLMQIPRFLRNFLTSVAWFYGGSNNCFFGPFNTFADGLQMLLSQVWSKYLLSWPILAF